MLKRIAVRRFCQLAERLETKEPEIAIRADAREEPVVAARDVSIRSGFVIRTFIWRSLDKQVDCTRLNVDWGAVVAFWSV